MGERLQIGAEHWNVMVRHVSEWRPEEACGLLGGPPGRVEAVYPVENVLHSPVAYEMDPRGQVEAMVRLEAEGWEIVGIFHSHPAGPATPSMSDVAQAYYPESVYVILSPGGETEWKARGFRIEAGGVREVDLVVE
jgi:proteasome lid subunit RPN8/RPN11